MTISLLFTLSVCGTKDTNNDTDTNLDADTNNSSTVETYKGTIGDAKLVGAWDCVSLDNKGDSVAGIAYGYDANLNIMYNGQCYGSLIESLYGLEDDGDWINPLCSIEAKNGQFTFKDISPEGEGTLDLKAEYKIGNIDKSSVSDRDTINKYYRDASDDQLTIHFTGTANTGPTEVKNIDFTLVYEKDGFADDEGAGILWAAMVGEWKDNYDNEWTFMPRTESKDLGFTMKTDSKEYKGQPDGYVAVSIGAYEIDDKITYLMSFSYEGDEVGDISRAQVISFNGNELVLEQDNGQQLIFKR